MIMHASLFVGWAPYFDQVVEHVPHFVAQIAFLYAFDLLLGFSRRDHVRTGFGPIPIVGSVNLFLWFQDEWFGLQFVLLAVGALAKEFLVWERDGRRRHVFNPSSFPLFLACVGLWATGSDDLTFASDIAVTQGTVPYGWLGIFLLGLVVQSLFSVTLVTLGALLAIFVLNQLVTFATGSFIWVDVGVPVAVYLGCHFLITDPATSPRSDAGRFVFGLLYGTAVTGLYLGLREVGGPAHYDKLLCVPFLNLLVRRLDRLGTVPEDTSGNRIHVALAALFYGLSVATHFVGTNHPGTSLPFWEAACREERWRGCEARADLVDERCHAGEWLRCEEYARLLIAGEGVERDLASAGYHYTLACQQGTEAACDAIPAYRAAGGDAALREACDADDGLSCLVLGVVTGGRFGEPADPEAAAAALARSCELGTDEACEFLEASGGKRLQP